MNAARPTNGPRRPGVGWRDDGSAALGLLGPLAAVLVVALVVVVDLGGYLLAAARAQAAADGAALAAAVAVADRPARDPVRIAREVAIAAGGDVVACRCRVGKPDVEVTVRMPVGGLVVPSVWARSVDATSAATTRRRR